MMLPLAVLLLCRITFVILIFVIWSWKFSFHLLWWFILEFWWWLSWICRFFLVMMTNFTILILVTHEYGRSWQLVSSSFSHKFLQYLKVLVLCLFYWFTEFAWRFFTLFNAIMKGMIFLIFLNFFGICI